jgi:hypothetical protein
MFDFPWSVTVWLGAAGILLLFVWGLARKYAPSMSGVPAWLASALLGAAVGTASTLAIIAWMGYVKASESLPPPPAIAMPGGGMGGGGMGGGGMGGGGMGGGGMGGGGTGRGGRGGGMAGGGGMEGMGMMVGLANSQRLTMLVGKLDLLSRGARVELSADQQRGLTRLLASLDQFDELTVADIDAKVAAIESLLSADQLAVVESIELARPRPASGGGRGGPSAGNPGSDSPRVRNPFLAEMNATRLNRLREHLAQSASESPAIASPATDVAHDLPTESVFDLPIREDLAIPGHPAAVEGTGGSQ